MRRTDECLSDCRFFDLVELGGLPPAGSLEGASGRRAADGPYRTDLIRRIEEAWRTRYGELTCAQVSLLIQQKAGLEWLGRPAITFARRFPSVSIDNYPGEMTVYCLKAADELAVAQPDFAEWLGGNFGWIKQTFGWSRPMLRDVEAALAYARSAGPVAALAGQGKSPHIRRGSRADGALANPVRSGRKQP